MLNGLVKFSASPHIKTPYSTRFIMLNVCIALLPTYIAGIVFFGVKAFLWVFISVLSSVASEIVYNLIIKKDIKSILNEFDFSSVVTGMLLGLTVGTNAPWYSLILGSMFAIIVVKMLFGGTGKNIVNPAIVGRIFIFLSFTSIVASGWAECLVPFVGNSTEITTGATVLTSTKEAGGQTVLTGILNSGSVPTISNIDLFLGTGISGCIGETCKLALVLGAIYLAIMGIIEIQYPIIYIGVCGLFQVALQGFDFELFLPSILSGGLFIGAFFMATDYVTTPNTKLGNYIYFVLLGLLTAGLRVATKMEVVSFAILLMNLIVPLIDKFVVNKPFGYIKKKKEAK